LVQTTIHEQAAKQGGKASRAIERPMIIEAEENDSMLRCWELPMIAA